MSYKPILVRGVPNFGSRKKYNYKFMSIKRRFEYQYRRLSAAAGAIIAPSWMMGNFFRVSITTLILLFGVGYISQISALSAGGYQLHDLEKQASSLRADIQTNEVEIAIHSSITNIEKRLADLNMVQVNGFQYIDTVDSAVAKR